MVTVAVACVPAETPEGSVPKLSTTLSPSSSTKSSIAANVKLCSMTSAANVTVVGTTV